MAPPGGHHPLPRQGGCLGVFEDFGMKGLNLKVLVDVKSIVAHCPAGLGVVTFFQHEFDTSMYGESSYHSYATATISIYNENGEMVRINDATKGEVSALYKYVVGRRQRISFFHLMKIMKG